MKRTKEQFDAGETREVREEAQNSLDTTAKLYNYALDRIEEQAKIIKSLEEQIKLVKNIYESQLIREQYATDRWKELQMLLWNDTEGTIWGKSGKQTTTDKKGNVVDSKH